MSRPLPDPTRVGEAVLPTWWGPQHLSPVFGGDGHEPPYLGLVGLLLRRWRYAKRLRRLSHLLDEALEARGREDEQLSCRPRDHREGVGNVLGPEEVRAGARLYRLLAHVEGHLAFQDVETFVFEVVEVQQTLFHREFRNEYLHQGIVPAGLLLGGFDGGQPAHPPHRLAFSRVESEDPAHGFFLCSVEHGLRLELTFPRRHVSFSFPRDPPITLH